MTTTTLCYVLVAIGLSTFHLCLGIWIGHAVEDGRQQALLPSMNRATTQCRSQLAETVALLKHARELGEACAGSRPQLPHRIVMSAEAIGRAAASLHSGMESLNQLMTNVQRTNSRHLASRAAAAPVVIPKPNSTLSVKGGSASQETFRYEVWQYVAPFKGDALPSAERFERVLCRDLSSSGFSFFSEELPNYEVLIVALGSPPDLRFFVSQITHSPAVSVRDQVGHLISCRFLRKLSDIYQWDVELGGIASVASVKDELLTQFA